MKKFLVMVLALVMGFTLVACTQSSKLSDADVDKMVGGFTTPTVIDATFKQKYELSIDDDRPFLQSFAAKVDDVVTIQMDLTANNVYYYGKKVAGQDVEEQLLVKEGDVYAYYTTTKARETVATDALAKTKVSELLTELSRETAGYVDLNVFTYSNTWVQDYILLGSENVDYKNTEFFTYTFEKSKDAGLVVNGTLKMIGYFGDMGTFEFGVDATHKGSDIKVVTNKNGQIVNFEQTLSNHLDMALFDPAAPLDLNGTRSLVAAYGGTLTKKTQIIQQLVTTSDIVLPTLSTGTVQSYDFKEGDYSTLNTPSLVVTAGNFVAVKVTLTEGQVLKVTVNNLDTDLVAGYYVLMEKAVAGETYTVRVTLDEPIAAIELPTVAGATIESYDFEYGNFASLDTPSSTVTPGHFVAVKVTTTGVVESVTINGEDAVNMNGFYVVVTQPAVAGATYVVKVVMAKGTIVLPTVAGVTIESYDFENNNFATLQTPSATVTPGNFVAIKVTPATGVASVTINGEVAINMNGYFVVVTQPAVSGVTYTVLVTLK